MRPDDRDHLIEVGLRTAVPLAIVRRRADPRDLQRLVPECCGRVWSALQLQGVRGGRHVAVYWDDAINVSVGVEALGAFREDGELLSAATPSGEIASTVHLGPYAMLGVAHAAVRAWCETNGRRLAGPRWELYGHWESTWDAHPERIRTDVCYLLDPVEHTAG